MPNVNDEDIRQFLTAFGDFMRHSETEIDSYEKREEAKEYANSLLEKKAAELEVTVTVDYYMAEFL
jgi:hypothetical protein